MCFITASSVAVSRLSRLSWLLARSTLRAFHFSYQQLFYRGRETERGGGGGGRDRERETDRQTDRKTDRPTEIYVVHKIEK